MDMGEEVNTNEDKEVNITQEEVKEEVTSNTDDIKNEYKENYHKSKEFRYGDLIN